MATHTYGFNALGLKLWQHDRELLDWKQKHLEIIKEDKCEPEFLNDAIDLWIAHIIRVNPRREMEALERIEEIVQRNPNNLNALADLSEIYRRQGREKQAEEVQRKLSIALGNEQSAENTAHALFEQAYVILFTESDNSQNVMIKKLKDTGDTIRKEMEHLLYADRKAELKTALHNIAVATHITSKVRPDAERAFYRETSSRYKSCVAKLQDARALLGDQSESKLTKYLLYFLAFANTRLLRCFEERHEDEKDDGKKTEYLNQSLTLFTDFIETCTSYQKCSPKSHDEDSDCVKLYQGRAMAYQICLISDERNDIAAIPNLPSSIRDIQTDREKAFDKVLATLTSRTIPVSSLDCFAANELAKAKLNAFKSSKENKYLYQAKDFLDSAKERQNCVWYTYSLSMQINKHLADVDRDRSGFLKLAYKDSYMCLSTKRTVKDLGQMTNICYQLSKFQEKEKHLKEAIGYINEVLAFGDDNNYFTALYMGFCLHDLGEKTIALEWMKKAMHRSDTCKRNKKRGFHYPFTYLLECYKESELSKQDKKHFLTHMKSLIKDGIAKFGSVEQELGYVFKTFPDECLDFSKYLATHPFSDTRVQRETIDTCSNYIPQELRTARCTEIIPKVQGKNIHDEFELSDAHLPCTPQEREVQPRGYRYDFFVCYHKEDRPWVIGSLLPFLELQHFDVDIQLSGCVDDRDFTPGKSIIDNTLQAIEESLTVLLIVSPDFVADRFRDFETESALQAFIAHNRCIIPIKLVECDLPQKLQTFVSYDVSGNSHDEELQKLKFRISSAAYMES